MRSSLGLTVALLSLLSASAFADLQSDHAAVHAEAVALAGAPLDMPRRAVILDSIYRDSAENYRFPIVALHGALWGFRFFQFTGPLGDELAKLSSFGSAERERHEVMIDLFSEAFAKTNQSVFIDTYTNYYFTKAHGTEAGAEKFLNSKLLAALNRVHAAAAGEVILGEDEKKAVFETALYFEQELTVGPAIQAAVDAFHWPVLKKIALKPVVRFAYFPSGRLFFFRNFANKKERIKRATEAYQIATEVGFAELETTMADYGVIPAEYFADRDAYVAKLKASLIPQENPDDIPAPL
jgi:hypothetical protein